MNQTEGDALKSVERKGVEEASTAGQSDSAREKARGKRGPAATVLLARTGLAVAAGADSMGGAMVAAGYSPATAKNPTANGVTIGRALQAAAEVFPDEPTNKAINNLSKRKLLERLQSDPSDQLLVTAYKTSGDAVRETGEDESDPDEARDMAECRLGLACSHLAAAMHYAKLGARFGSRRVVAALQARMDEVLPNKAFAMHEWRFRGVAERDGLECLHPFTNVMLGDMIVGCGDARDYRRARRAGFILPSVAGVRGSWMDRP